MDGLKGFVTANPALNRDKNGRPYLRVEWGHRTWSRGDDGTFTETGAEYGTLVYRGDDAADLFARLRKGDEFLALGQASEYSYTAKDGSTRTKPVFKARHLGHDASRTQYAIYRGPRVLAEQWAHTQGLVAQDFAQRAERLGADQALGQINNPDLHAHAERASAAQAAASAMGR